MAKLLRLLSGAVPFLLIVSLGLPASAQNTYLNDKKTFDTAWTLLGEQIGGSDLLWLRLQPGSLSVIAATGQNGEEFNLWTVQRIKNDQGFVDSVQGPMHMADGPKFIVPPGRFSQAEVQISRLWEILGSAPDGLPTKVPGEVTSAVASLGPVLGQTQWAVKWNISIKSGREFGQVYVLADGRLDGADISHTERGRSMNLRTQSDWPFENAQGRFADIFGAGESVFKISVLTHGVEIDAVEPTDPAQVQAYRWNGGSFRRGAVAKPMSFYTLTGRSLPFAITASGLARLPQIVAAARAEAPAGWTHVDRVEATRPPPAGSERGVLWVIELQSAAGGREKAVVRVRPDASIHSVTLPESLRAFDSYMSLKGMSDAFVQFQTTLGKDIRFFEMTFRQDRASITLPDPEAPGNVVDYTLGSSGITRGFSRPRIMENDADLITFTQASQFHHQLVTHVPAMLVKAFKTENAEVFKIKLWNGAPFYKDAKGALFMQMYVGVPPQHNNSGHAVFRFDGEYVDGGR
ncbi:hypothetical protein K1718_03760 [Roseibium porphyridii]|uniref:Uncharacterized protein n=1 Tax=Roseibium porphyridii TaxID=2866279 RepID=A0ABY8F9D6_9HYPH|nr:hypothetical protein [Roseibium sp. KMA01]WFE90480.1 hypothetical protein K1718_03760 [Roseibium sp. KMA01]